MKQIQSVMKSNASTMSPQFNLDLIQLLNPVKGCPHENDALAAQSRAGNVRTGSQSWLHGAVGNKREQYAFASYHRAKV